MNEKSLFGESLAPDLANFYGCSQEEFENYWFYYMEFSPDYFIG